MSISIWCVIIKHENILFSLLVLHIVLQCRYTGYFANQSFLPHYQIFKNCCILVLFHWFFVLLLQNISYHIKKHTMEKNYETQSKDRIQRIKKTSRTS